MSALFTKNQGDLAFFFVLSVVCYMILGAKCYLFLVFLVAKEIFDHKRILWIYEYEAKWAVLTLKFYGINIYVNPHTYILNSYVGKKIVLDDLSQCKFYDSLPNESCT